MRAVTASRVPGRWVWGVSGVATAALLTVAAVRIMGHAASTSVTFSSSITPGTTTSRTFTVPQRVSAVTVDSYGAPVRITAGTGPRVRVTEDISYVGKGPYGPYGPGRLPAVTDTVSGGRLTLADPVCGGSDCSVAIIVTVPAGTASAVSSQGGPVIVSGVAAPVNVNSGGGVVDASGLGGPLTADTGGGPLVVDGLSGSLTASTGGGFADASGLTSPEVTVTTGGGPTVLSFGAAPRTVTVATNGGSARIGVPGGPYALAADSGGGLESVEIATDPSAGRALTVSTGGGPLLIAPSVPGVPRPVKGIFLPGPFADGEFPGFKVGSASTAAAPGTPSSPGAPGEPGVPGAPGKP